MPQRRVFGARRFRASIGIVAMVLIGLAVARGTQSAQPSAAQAAPTAATISIDADPAQPGIQENASQPLTATLVSVDVVVQNANQIGAFEFQFLFDSSSLAFDSYTLGSFLAGTNRVASCQIIPSEHTIRLGCNTTGPISAGASGDGVLATLRFKPLAAGPSCMQLGLVETATVNGDPLPTTSRDACMTITSEATTTPTTSSSTTVTPTSTATTTPTPTTPPDATSTATMTSQPSATSTDTAAETETPTAAPSSTSTQAATPVPPLPTATRTPEPQTACARADIDGDGRVTIGDVVAIAFGLVTDSRDVRYDIDADGEIGIADLLAGLRCLTHTHHHRRR